MLRLCLLRYALLTFNQTFTHSKNRRYVVFIMVRVSASCSKMIDGNMIVKEVCAINWKNDEGNALMCGYLLSCL